MYFSFGTRKIIEAAATLLRTTPCHRMEYMRLLKLLYIADRESLRETGRPIIGTQPFAMDRGPIHSGVLDLIGGSHGDGPMWERFIRKDGYDVELHEEPGVAHLSRYDIEKLTQAAERYRNVEIWDLVEETHKFPEWAKNYHSGTSTPIPFEDILEAVGRAKDRAEIIEDLQETKALNRLLGTAP